MQFEEFVSKYAVHFGPLPADMADKVQLKEWGVLVDAIRPDRLDTLIERISVTMGKSIKKPRIRDFRAALADMDQPVTPIHVQGCGLCNDTGYLTVLGWIDSTKEFYDESRYKVGSIGNNSRLYRVAAPCKCSKGRKIAIDAGYNPAVLATYHAWFDGFMGECRLTGQDPSDRMRELEHTSVEMFGYWPTPNNTKRPPNPSELPQEAPPRPMATVACPPVDRSPPITADDSGPNW
ncbi:MAG: hypothetical protein MUC88_20830 [Planctomycetes bacterium]|jgi:hypothetical protein|nr:hypothetical protein [Planctomycetota bacterium]